MSQNTSEKEPIKMTAPRLKARNIHIIRRAALHCAFPNCPLCGMPNNLETSEFTRNLGDGITVEFNLVDATLDYCHLTPREKGGSNTPDNLFVGHHKCNMQQNTDTIEVHCAQFRTALSASEIRTLTAQADARATEMMNGKVLHSDIQNMAARMLAIGKTQRTGTKWTKTIQAA